MWYRASKFASEEASNKVYKPLQDTLFTHNIDISVYRFVLAGKWHIIVIADDKPSDVIIRKADTFLNQGTLTSLPEDILKSFMQRREDNKHKARHKTPSGYVYEGHTPTPLHYTHDTPIPDKDLEATALETASFLNKKYGLNIDYKQPDKKPEVSYTPSPNEPFIVTHQHVHFTGVSNEVMKRVASKSNFFTKKQNIEDATTMVNMIDRVQIERLKNSLKYLFTPSAMKLHESVFHLYNETPLALPVNQLSTHIWIELANPLNTPYGEFRAIYANNAYPLAEIERVAPVKIQASLNSMLKETFYPHIEQWSLEVIHPSGETMYDLTFDTVSNQWQYLASHICPTHECKYIADKFDDLHTIGTCIPCDRCKHANAFFCQWFITALDIINRKYTISPEPKPFSTEVQEYETQGTIMVGKGKNKHAIKSKVTRKVAYTLIDVSVTPTPKPKISDEEKTEKRENWLTLHGTNERIYRKVHFTHQIRRYTGDTYSHLIKRCLQENSFIENGREYTLDFLPDGTPSVVSSIIDYDKYVPMLHPDVRKTPIRIKKVVATQYEDK